MKAIVHTRYGPPEVLSLEEVAKPEPRANEVLVRVRATAVSSGDCRARGFKNIPPLFWLPSRLAFGLTRPRNTILGSEFAGEIAAVGNEVEGFEPGDEVFGYTGLGFGAYAEYLCLPADGVLAMKPANMNHEEAAGAPFGALTALFFLRKGQLRSGERILINGASGAVGTAAVQLAKDLGADVTGVCSTGKLDLVRSLGADRVIDYTRDDFTQGDRVYDVVFDTVGKSTFAGCRRVLTGNGRYLLTVFGPVQLLQMLGTSLSRGPKVICAMSSERTEDLVFLKGLMEAGRLKSVIDRRYPLAQTADAHRYVEQGHKQGSVVITLDPEGGAGEGHV